MDYKIEYSPEYTKIKLTDRKGKRSELALFFVAGLLVAGFLLFGMEKFAQAVTMLEQLAAQVRQDGSVAEVFSSFSHVVRGAISG